VDVVDPQTGGRPDVVRRTPCPALGRGLIKGDSKFADPLEGYPPGVSGGPPGTSEGDPEDPPETPWEGGSRGGVWGGSGGGSGGGQKPPFWGGPGGGTCNYINPYHSHFGPST